MTFQELNIHESLLKAIDEQGYTQATPIQEQAIPVVLAGRDVLGCAQTGTGKTAAFAIPIIQALAAQPSNGKKRAIKALVLTPTRELACQISACFANYGRHTSLRHTVIYGGVKQLSQTRSLQQGADILIATPGRLHDLINQGFIKLNQVTHFVLDEADQMLDMGFIHDIKRLIPLLPKNRQTLLFSATMPNDIRKLAQNILIKPKEISIAPEAPVIHTIEQYLYFVEKKEKGDLLFNLLAKNDKQSALVFSRTKHGADKIAKTLSKKGVSTAAIHGNKSQNARQNTLDNFKRGKIRVMIATDIAARGLDISELPMVVNYDLPEVPETYVHRIGRTGRAGHQGIAYSFCSLEEKKLLVDIQKKTGRNIPVLSS